MTNSDNSSSIIPGKSATRVRKMAEGQINVGNQVQLNDEFFLQHRAMREVQKIIEDKLEQANEAAIEQSVQIIENAKAEAQALLEKAQQDAQVLIDEGFSKQQETIQSAYDNAYKDAYEDTMQKIATQVHMGDSLLHQATYTAEQLKKAFVNDLSDIVLGITQSILKQELQNNPQGLIKVIEQAIESIGILHDNQASIIVHPDSLKEIGLDNARDFKRLRFMPDTDCPKGRIYLDTVTTRWDISPEVQAQLYVESIKPILETKLSAMHETTVDKTQVEDELLDNDHNN